MAQSRLEKIGTIFTRVTGLLRSRAMKQEDKPIWYDVYAAFPPKLEPRFDRPASTNEIRNIFYEEDIVRAKFHKSHKYIDMVNLNDSVRKSRCQEFIGIYNKYKEEGALDAEQVFNTANTVLNERRNKSGSNDKYSENIEMNEEKMEPTKSESTYSFHSPKQVEKSDVRKDSKKVSTAINIENLFKD